ncbi:DNA-binding protein SATB2 [Gryllus bimaculatus]|nr:DNA-binding protein SATB2 [Gryllus bimaculatus]
MDFQSAMETFAEAWVAANTKGGPLGDVGCSQNQAIALTRGCKTPPSPPPQQPPPPPPPALRLSAEPPPGARSPPPPSSTPQQDPLLLANPKDEYDVTKGGSGIRMLRRRRRLKEESEGKDKKEVNKGFFTSPPPLPPLPFLLPFLFFILCARRRDVLVGVVCAVELAGAGPGRLEWRRRRRRRRRGAQPQQRMFRSAWYRCSYSTCSMHRCISEWFTKGLYCEYLTINFCFMSENAVAALGGDGKLGWKRRPVVETDSYVIIPANTAFHDLVAVALARLGYPTDSASAAKGSVVIKNWKPLNFDKITDGAQATVEDILGELTTVATLRIELYRARPSVLNDIKDKLLRLLLLQSHGLLLSAGCPLDEDI